MERESVNLVNIRQVLFLFAISATLCSDSSRPNILLVISDDHSVPHWLSMIFIRGIAQALPFLILQFLILKQLIS